MPNDNLINEAREFALKRHKLFFDREENLPVGANFIDSMAAFAAQKIAEVEKRITEMNIFVLNHALSLDEPGEFLRECLKEETAKLEALDGGTHGK